MINIRGNKNFTVYRGDTFEFACRINLFNLLKSVTFICKKLGIRRSMQLYEGCFYLRLSSEETAAISQEISACNYSILIETISGTVTTLFIDGVLEIVDGAASDSTSRIEELSDDLTVVNDFHVDPSFEVDIYSWLRVQVPTMKFVDELPTASIETLFQLYYCSSDNNIYVTYFDSDGYVWKAIPTKDYVDTNKGTKLYLHQIAKNEYMVLYLFSTSGDSKVGKTLQQVLDEETTVDIKYKWYSNYHEIFFNGAGETYVPTTLSTKGEVTYGNPTPILNKSDEITIDYVTEL